MSVCGLHRRNNFKIFRFSGHFFGNIPYNEARRTCNILSLAERRYELGKRFFQRIIEDKSNVLFYLLPAKRDVQLTTRLRRARQYPTIYARTNRCKNSFILFRLNHSQWRDVAYARFLVCLFNPAFRGCQNPINGLCVCDAARSVCLSLRDTIVSAAKTAEPIEVPFEMWTRGASKEPYIKWGLDPRGKGQFWGHFRPTVTSEDTQIGSVKLAYAFNLTGY